ncbi:PITH domain containing protein [Trichuris trichiura]|uniref:PITH domain containing protein n=1 Tax=Trichuris trichiura TaxID=36087 RepID=A0A077ZG19_TRITR|nr:PITH domain containing protein [Trichuris trichiura]
MSDCHCGEAEHEHELEEEEEEEKDVANMFSLYKYIDFENFTCLNELVDGSGKKVFRAWDKRMDRYRNHFVESDTDEELLFNLPFAGIVKLKKMVLIGGCAESRPTYARLFKNRPNMSFDETNGTPVQEFELKLDVEGQVPYSLRMARFSDVHHLSIHIPRNAGADTTIVYYIGLDGYYVGPQRHGIPIVVDAVYEARPMPQDHKIENLEHAAEGRQFIETLYG